MTPMLPDNRLRHLLPGNRPVYGIAESIRTERALQEALYKAGHKNPLSKAFEIVDKLDRHDKAVRIAEALSRTLTTPEERRVAERLLHILTGRTSDST